MQATVSVAHACSATASQGCRRRFNKQAFEVAGMIKRKVRTFDRQYRLLTHWQWYQACMMSYRIAMERLQG